MKNMLKLKDNIWYVGVINPNLRVFDIIMSTEYGTTYNAYLIKGDKTALVESVHNRFSEQFFKNIKEICAPSEIDYIIFNHTEPDHSGSIEKLLEYNPDITVIGSAAAIKNISNISNKAFKSRIVKTGDSLDLGQGLVFEFITAPNLHWPDSIFSYLPARKTVFTCDFLGAHYCEPMITDNEITYIDAYKSAFENYYQAIFGPFKKFVIDGLKKLETLDFDMVCCSHGPVLEKQIKYTMEKYAEWSAPKATPKNVAIFYVSAYGYTEKIADMYEKQLNLLGIPAKKYDIIKYSITELKEKLEAASGILFGSPTINRDALKPVWDLLSVTDAITNRGKSYAVFGSYGWSGEACAMLESRADSLGLKKAHDAFKVVMKPSEEDLEKVKELAKQFAEQL
jgi:flavorubredoxin